jgi:predicted nucleotidyltransferase
MMLAKDFAEFIELLNKRGVEYMIVGGYALAFHGRPRNTGDLDIWIENSESNAIRMLEVVKDFGLASMGFTKEDFIKEGYISQIGFPPVRIDILNSIDGVQFREAYPNRKVINNEGIKIPYIGREEFIKNKQAAGRAQDLNDVKELQRNGRKPGR